MRRLRATSWAVIGRGRGRLEAVPVVRDPNPTTSGACGSAARPSRAGVSRRRGTPGSHGRRRSAVRVSNRVRPNLEPTSMWFRSVKASTSRCRISPKGGDVISTRVTSRARELAVELGDAGRTWRSAAARSRCDSRMNGRSGRRARHLGAARPDSLDRAACRSKPIRIIAAAGLDSRRSRRPMLEQSLARRLRQPRRGTESTLSRRRLDTRATTRPPRRWKTTRERTVACGPRSHASRGQGALAEAPPAALAPSPMATTGRVPLVRAPSDASARCRAIRAAGAGSRRQPLAEEIESTGSADHSVRAKTGSLDGPLAPPRGCRPRSHIVASISLGRERRDNAPP